MEQQLELKVKSYTVIKAVLKAFNQMPKRFSSLTFCLTVRSIQNRQTMDGTILRRLREAREAEQVNYKVINAADGIYEKVED